MNKTLVSWALAMCSIFVCAQAHAKDVLPLDCHKYAGTSQYRTCLNAKTYSLSFNAAAVVEGLAEYTYAVEFCGGTVDPSKQKHTESLLAGSSNFRKLYEDHLTMLRERCIYDPKGWCMEHGFAP